MNVDFTKSKEGLVPAIIQDATTAKVLMLGYMNAEALQQTQHTQRVTFFSRSKKRLWTKGEESGHFLELVDIRIDCDNDTLLIQANPKGPTCHTGADTCWNEKNTASFGFLSELEETIHDRKQNDQDASYIASLFRKGINKIAQKVGEEAVETVIESKDNNSDLFLNESADLLFHLLILLQAKGYRLEDVVGILEKRKK
jgi:phosphoribosyl-ATP pyrophosphohydrolase/phosphoribosyl-AMP cyclohydrolase